ncbi:acyl carrier protein [Klebsiella grimontii]|uniref:acyl carrier protein n=1 Tax=Klebsiella grimontii TaxID=2058152 RepID=UPI001166BC66|nr:acyl carrier protein [Klebsiella grimontii]VUS46724.1 Acyl carrier protein [Klebsiella grimontii]
MKQINKEVIDILVKNFGLDEGKVCSNQSLESLGVDSIIVIEIQLDLERAFSITIEDGDIPASFNLNDIVVYIKSKVDCYAA